MGVSFTNRLPAHINFASKSQSLCNTWLQGHLNMVGRLVLLRSVVNSLPAFNFQAFLIPLHITEQMDRMRRSLLWNHTSNSKKCIIFLGSLLSVKRESLLFQVLGAKYHVHSDNVWTAIPAAGCSWGWRCLCKGLAALEVGLQWEISNGHLVHVWDDPWVSTEPLRRSCADYILVDTQTWTVQSS